MVENTAAIAVLGPSHQAVDDAVLSAARAVGRELASQGYVVVVMGGAGVAEAVASSALAVDGEVVAVTIEGSRPSFSDRVTLLEASSVLRQMETALQLADAVVVLPGDLPALATMLQIWSYGLTPDAPYRQMILLGERWPSIVKALADAAALDQRTRAMVTFADSPEQGVESLRYYINAS